MSSAKKLETLIGKIPARINTAQTLKIVHSNTIDFRHVGAIKELTNLSDTDISYCLNVNVKTFRKYRDEEALLNSIQQEHVVVLLALMKHGIQIFGTSDKFTQWLKRENFYFDGKTPMEYLDKINGIKFVDDRLTAMEYGDNV